MISIVLALQVAVASQQQSQTVDATVIETSVEVTSTAPGQTESAKPSRMRMTIHGSAIRYDNLEGQLATMFPITGPGSYTLLLDGGSTLYTIDTATKEFSKLDLQRLSEEMGDLFSALGPMNMSVSDASSDVDSLGAGDTVLGYPTNRWRSVLKMTISASMGADSMTMSAEMRTEAHYAPALDSILGQVGRQMRDSLTTLTPFHYLLPEKFTETLWSAMNKLPKMMPMKSVATQVMMMGPVDMTTTTTTEVTGLEKVKRPASYFAVPEGYKEVESTFPLKPESQ